MFPAPSAGPHLVRHNRRLAAQKEENDYSGAPVTEELRPAGWRRGPLKCQRPRAASRGQATPAVHPGKRCVQL